MIKLICAICIAVFWLIVVTLITITSSNTLYYCDPEKNTECSKTNCYINGGKLPAHNSQKVQEEEMTLPEIIEDLDAILCRCLDRYSMTPADVAKFARLIAELKVYAESHEDDLK